MILARFGRPSCGHVGDIFGKNGEALSTTVGFDVVLLIFFEFWYVWGRCWNHFGPSRTDFGQMFD